MTCAEWALSPSMVVSSHACKSPEGFAKALVSALSNRALLACVGVSRHSLLAPVLWLQGFDLAQ
jgi:hypothetical protein